MSKRKPPTGGLGEVSQQLPPKQSRYKKKNKKEVDQYAGSWDESDFSVWQKVLAAGSSFLPSDGDSSSDDSEYKMQRLYESLSAAAQYTHWSEADKLGSVGKSASSKSTNKTKVAKKEMQEKPVVVSPSKKAAAVEISEVAITTSVERLDFLSLVCGEKNELLDLEDLKEALGEIAKKNFMLLQNWLDKKIYCAQIIVNRLKEVNEAIKNIVATQDQGPTIGSDGLLWTFEHQLQAPIDRNERRKVQEYSVVGVVGFIKSLLEIVLQEIHQIKDIEKIRSTVPEPESGSFQEWSQKEVVKLNNLLHIVEKIIMPDVKEVAPSLCRAKRDQVELKEAFYDIAAMLATESDAVLDAKVSEIGGGDHCFAGVFEI